jgi:hypothetical protein
MMQLAARTERADDVTDADGLHVLDYSHALDEAGAWFAEQSGPSTIQPLVWSALQSLQSQRAQLIRVALACARLFNDHFCQVICDRVMPTHKPKRLAGFVEGIHHRFDGLRIEPTRKSFWHETSRGSS